MDKVVGSAAQAVAHVRLGSTIAAGGFELCGIPSVLIAALHEAGVDELEVVSNNAGVDDWGLGGVNVRPRRPRRAASVDQTVNDALGDITADRAQFELDDVLGGGVGQARHLGATQALRPAPVAAVGRQLSLCGGDSGAAGREELADPVRDVVTRVHTGVRMGAGTPGSGTGARAGTSPVTAPSWMTTVLGRVDDVMNVSGHRLSTTEIESALVSNPKVAEAAVVGAKDAETVQVLRQHVRMAIGPIATPRQIMIVAELPKTRFLVE